MFGLTSNDGMGSARVEGVRIPEVGELVVATVVRVDRHGAIVRLDEYEGLEAYVHISEISLKWIRNIRDYLREGQKTILKVIRTNPQTLQVDASLRRVSKKEFDEKMLEWGRKQKVRKMLEILIERTKVSREEVESGLLRPVEARHIDLYKLFEEVASGEQLPDWVTLPENVKNVLTEICRKEIKREVVVVKRLIKMEAKRAGVSIIREAAAEAMKVNGRGESVTITITGAPKYLLRVEASDKRRALELADNAYNVLRSKLSEVGGTLEILNEEVRE